jgi:hypothetical protein
MKPMLSIMVFAAAVAGQLPDPAVAAEPQLLPPIARAQWDRSTPAASIRGIISASKAADPGWILAAFAPAERARMGEMIRNPAMLKANSAIYWRMVSASVRGVRFYRGYAIVTVAEQFQGGKRHLKNYPLKRTPEGWLLTNDLAADDNFKPYG